MDEQRKWKNANNEGRKDGITTEDWRTNWREPQTRPRRNIL